MKRRSRRALAAVAAALIVGSIAVIAPPANAANLSWTGAAGGSWNTATNWSPASVPASGDALSFPAGATTLAMTNDVAANTPFTLNFNGAGYTLQGNPLSPAQITQSVGGTNQILTPISESVSGTALQVPVNVGPSNGVLILGGVISGAVGIQKTGSGTLVLSGANTYNGATTLNGGSLVVAGSINASSVTVTSGILAGGGSTGPVTATGGAIAPGPAGGAGILTVNGPLQLGANVTVSFEILGATPGTLHDRLTVTGGVALNGAVLNLTGTFAANASTQFVLIDNTGGSPISGTFANLPENSTFQASNGVTYRINYTGGQGGNDVVLTQVSGKVAIVLSGEDRIATAVNVSRAAYPAAGSANAVVLARGDLFPDALAGAPLAVARTAPLLLANLVAPATTIDPRTVSEIQRVLTTGKTVFILGGTTALPDAILQQVQSLGYVAVRLGGVDRWDTAVRIAQQGLTNPTNLFLTDGINFPDALSAGPVAAKFQGAILLTNGSQMMPVTSQYLASRTGTTIFAIGGPAANTGAAPAGNRVVGADRYQTAVLSAQRFFVNPNPTAVGIATGEAFPDGLTGGAHIGKIGGPLLLTQTNNLPSVVQGYLQGIKATLVGAFIYGGTAAVSQPVVVQINTAIA